MTTCRPAALADQLAPARHAINAGLDLAMYAQAGSASAAAYSLPLANARATTLSVSRVRAAYLEIVALNRRLGTG